MPGSTHEGIRLLFQNRPSLVRELLTALGLDVPAGDACEDANAFSDVAPPTYAADVVVLIRGDEGPRASLIVEVQGAEDEEKRFAWPRYAATEHALRRCPTWVVVIALSRKVATWARRPVETFQPGCGFAPLVLGPDEVPRITDLAAALADPELAVLSAVLHGADDDGSIAAPAIEAARSLDTERRLLYTDLVFGSLTVVARAAVEAMMQNKNWEPLTPEIREALHKGRAEGLGAAVRTACELLGIAWTADHERHVSGLDAAGLEALRAELVRTRRWPVH